MKNNAFLALMEQIIMTLVFALAAALCLQVFILSEQMSLRSEAQSHALIVTQTVAESLKGSFGDMNYCADLLGGTVQNDCWNIFYDEQWQIVEADEASYRLQVSLDLPSIELLGSATLAAQTIDGEELISLSVSWQEVDPHE